MTTHCYHVRCQQRATGRTAKGYPARYAGLCSICHEAFKPGEFIGWDRRVPTLRGWYSGRALNECPFAPKRIKATHPADRRSCNG